MPTLLEVAAKKNLSPMQTTEFVGAYTYIEQAAKMPVTGIEMADKTILGAREQMNFIRELEQHPGLANAAVDMFKNDRANFDRLIKLPPDVSAAAVTAMNKHGDALLTEIDNFSAKPTLENLDQIVGRIEQKSPAAPSAATPAQVSPVEVAVTPTGMPAMTPIPSRNVEPPSSDLLQSVAPQASAPVLKESAVDLANKGPLYTTDINQAVADGELLADFSVKFDGFINKNFPELGPEYEAFKKTQGENPENVQNLLAGLKENPEYTKRLEDFDKIESTLGADAARDARNAIRPFIKQGLEDPSLLSDPIFMGRIHGRTKMALEPHQENFMNNMFNGSGLDLNGMGGMEGILGKFAEMFKPLIEKMLTALKGFDGNNMMAQGNSIQDMFANLGQNMNFSGPVNKIDASTGNVTTYAKTADAGFAPTNNAGETFGQPQVQYKSPQIAPVEIVPLNG